MTRRKRTSKRIQSHGNAGNTKKGNKEEVKALMAEKKKREEEKKQRELQLKIAQHTADDKDSNSKYDQQYGITLGVKKPSSNNNSSSSNSQSSSLRHGGYTDRHSKNSRNVSANKNSSSSSSSLANRAQHRPNSTSATNAMGQKHQEASSSLGESLWAGSSTSDDREQHAKRSDKVHRAGYDLTRWTGKKPQAWLYDFCRKKNWEKPHFKVETRGPWLCCKIFLKRKNPKTGGMDKYYSNNKRVYETKLEAVNMASVYTLHKVNFDKAMDHLLPPGYRDYWLELEEERRNNPKVNFITTPQDPFDISQAIAQRQEDKRIAHVQRERKRELDPRNIFPTVQIKPALMSKIEGIVKEIILVASQHGLNHEARMIEDASFEERHNANGNDRSGRRGKKSHSNSINEQQGQANSALDSIKRALKKEGFHEIHIAEAWKYSQTRTEVLDWLCVHLAEADLPEAYQQKVTQTAGYQRDQQKLARELKIRRLVDIGFNRQLSAHALGLFEEKCQALFEFSADQVSRYLANYEDSCEHYALALLTAVLMNSPETLEEASRLEKISKGLVSSDDEDDTSSPLINEKTFLSACLQHFPWIKASLGTGRGEEAEEDIEMELFSLKAIFEDALVHTPPSLHDPAHKITIKLTIAEKAELALVVIIPSICDYPSQRPLIAVTSEQVPTYITLQIMKQLNCHASDCVGDHMINDLVMWLEAESEKIIKNPPPLLQISAVGKMRSESSFSPTAPAQLHGIGDIFTASDQHDNKKQGQQRTQRSTSTRLRRNKTIDEKLQRAEDALQKTEKYQRMRARREKLPSFAFREEILKCIEENSVTIISGATGCGKTTQIPQFLLEKMFLDGTGSLCNIICTQPRRLSATAVSSRVAQERAQTLGSDVGYKIRLDSKASKSTRLLFCTTGIILRQLHQDPMLSGISHIIVDEVHERSLDSDVLLTTLRNIARSRKDLKIVLMSATINAEKFSAYFGGAPVIKVPGFTYPVTEYYLEDIVSMTGYRPPIKQLLSSKEKPGAWVRRPIAGEEDASLKEELITSLSAIDSIDYALVGKIVHHIISGGETGAILVFMPGVGEIKSAMAAIASETKRLTGCTVDILPLHSLLTPQEQGRIFMRPQKGTIKVIVSTNIAETSITVDDVTSVIDCGKHKENSYDSESNMELLLETWVSQAAAQQRRGRAGRVKPGNCYRCFTRRRFYSLKESQDPEVLRVPLDHLCLQLIVSEKGRQSGHTGPPTASPAKTSGRTHAKHSHAGGKSLHGRAANQSTHELSIKTFLSTMMDPPEESAVQSALDHLHTVGAITRDERATALGEHIAQFPIGIQQAKLIIFGAVLRCLDPILTITACTGCKPLFFSPHDKRDEANAAKLKFKTSSSDHLTIINAFNAARDVFRQSGYRAFADFCAENFISRTAVEDVLDLRMQMYTILYESGFAHERAPKNRLALLGSDGLNVHSGSGNVILSCVYAGLFPNVVRAVLPKATFTKVESGAVKNSDVDPKEIKLFGKEPGRVFYHPSSTLFSETRYRDNQYLIFTKKMQTSRIFIHTASLLPSIGAILFGGDMDIDHKENTVVLDGWIRFQASPRVAVFVKKIKGAFEALFALKIKKPELDITQHPIFDAVSDLIS